MMGRSGCGPLALNTEPLPRQLQSFVDEVLVVQQRIQRLDVTQAQCAQLSRELRRAIQIGRHDVDLGHVELSRLHVRLKATERHRG